MTNIEIAVLAPMVRVSVIDLKAVVAAGIQSVEDDKRPVATEWVGDSCRLSVRLPTCASLLDIADVATVLALLAYIDLEHAAQVRWTSSGLNVAGTDAAGLIRQWNAERWPPTLAIVNIARSASPDTLFATRGLAPYVAHELAIEPVAGVDEDLRHAIVMASGHALLRGPSYREAQMTDRCGRVLRFVPETRRLPNENIVKIEF